MIACAIYVYYLMWMLKSKIVDRGDDRPGLSDSGILYSPVDKGWWSSNNTEFGWPIISTIPEST